MRFRQIYGKPKYKDNDDDDDDAEAEKSLTDDIKSNSSDVENKSDDDLQAPRESKRSRTTKARANQVVINSSKNRRKRKQITKSHVQVISDSDTETEEVKHDRKYDMPNGEKKKKLTTNETPSTAHPQDSQSGGDEEEVGKDYEDSVDAGGHRGPDNNKGPGHPGGDSDNKGIGNGNGMADNSSGRVCGDASFMEAESMFEAQKLRIQEVEKLRQEADTAYAEYVRKRDMFAAAIIKNYNPQNPRLA